MTGLETGFLISTIAGLATAVSAGFLGTFMVMRRISLVSDALSHVALPGLALALIYNFNPYFGAFAALLIAAILVAGIEQRTKLPVDAVVGVLFSASLAFGILLTPDHELLEALFGDFTDISTIEAVTTVIVSLGIMAVTALIWRPLMLSIVAADMAHLPSKKARFAELVFLMMLAGVVALGIKFVGTLLMGTLTVIPAAAAKNVAKSLLGFALTSMAFAAISVILGMGAVFLWGIPAGAAVVLVAAGIFLLTLVKRVI